jgi:hypothetical protein
MPSKTLLSSIKILSTYHGRCGAIGGTVVEGCDLLVEKFDLSELEPLRNTVKQNKIK